MTTADSLPAEHQSHPCRQVCAKRWSLSCSLLPQCPAALTATDALAPPPPASPRAAAHHGPPPPRVLLHLAVRHQSGRAADGGLVGELGQRVPGHVVEHRGALRCVRSQVRRRYKAVGCGGAAVVSMGTNALHLAPTLSRAFAAEHRSSSSRLVPSLPPSTHTHLLIVAQRQQLARGAPADRLDTQQVVLVG